MNGPPPPIRPAGRVPPERFQLPVERMREGYYSDKYFVRAREVLVADSHAPRVLMQVFGTPTPSKKTNLLPAIAA